MPSSLVSSTRSSKLVVSLGDGWIAGSCRLFGFFRGALELDDVAVGVRDVERGTVALGTIAPADLADRDAVAPQMRRQCREIKGADAHREVVEVAPGCGLG